MNLIKWTPRSSLLRPFGIDSWADETDRFFDSFARWPVHPSRFHDADWLPSFDVVEKEKEHEVRVEAPGMKKSDFHVAAKDGVLTISGEKKDEESKNGDRYSYRESRYGRFSRSFRLPDEATEKNIKANYKDGVLTVSLPRSKPLKAKEIEVEIS
ncbi:MAG: Hsp20/alpha crystallin family protein [Candidatus Neomarinimicrobiota bacterium]